jgi:hypothetical protein
LVLDLQPTAQESVSGSRRVGWHHGVVESGAGIDYRRLIEGVGTCQLGSRRIVGSTASSRSGTLGSWRSWTRWKYSWSRRISLVKVV